MNLRTEKAIKTVIETKNVNCFFDSNRKNITFRKSENGELIATFTLKSLIAKRYPRRKKK